MKRGFVGSLGAALALAGALLTTALLAGCDDSALPPPRATGAAASAGLTAKQAALVLAKVGDKTITLGDYAATLERMNQIDRLRFQSPERRRDLLNQMIDLELLAQEARRREIDKRPEVQDAVRQILRDAMLAKARAGNMAPAHIPAADVKAYYDAHKEDFREPERRRVAAIVLGDPDKADEVMNKLKAGGSWGELYFEHSLNAPHQQIPGAPADLAGDLGIVGPPGDAKGDNAAVPEVVRKAAFELAQVNDVLPRIIQQGERYYIIRLISLSPGHTRTLAEADQAIRVAILQKRIREREKAMEMELRKSIPVTIDEDALAAVKLPDALKKYKPVLEGAAASTAEPAAP